VWLRSFQSGCAGRARHWQFAEEAALHAAGAMKNIGKAKKTEEVTSSVAHKRSDRLS